MDPPSEQEEDEYEVEDDSSRIRGTVQRRGEFRVVISVVIVSQVSVVVVLVVSLVVVVVKGVEERAK